MKKRFIVINEGFTCKNCKTVNTPLKGGCRNHCCACLCSLHVDEKTPGDRLSECQGLMHPIAIDYSGKKGFIIVHECEKCGAQKKNKSSVDDSNEQMIRIMQESRGTHKVKRK